ncbi:MAG TPA: transcriptional regulator [Gammaproteobacteria bacterium]|nr:transcriptional regulator [Gammaproteobacteria bacterium]
MTTEVLQADEPIVEQKKRGHGLRKLVEFYRLRSQGLLLLFGYVFIVALIGYGWRIREEQPFTPESGFGYALGIIGGSLMLLLLLYPLRKHSPRMRRWGPIRYWFKVHMFFGVIGPVCVIFHSGYQLGSMNSTIALFCTLLVASSGLVGRYFYTRIHHGLYGRKATLEELGRHVHLLAGSLEQHLADFPEISERIDTYAERARTRPKGLLPGMVNLVATALYTWGLYLRMWWILRRLPGRERRALLRHIGALMQSMRKVADFHFYERLFSLWHMLHFPLFLMLLLSGIVHVIAVHMY